MTAALRGFGVSVAGKIGLEYRSRWWETDQRIYGGTTETDLDLAHVWYPSYGYHGRRGPSSATTTPAPTPGRTAR